MSDREVLLVRGYESHSELTALGLSETGTTWTTDERTNILEFFDRPVQIFIYFVDRIEPPGDRLRERARIEGFDCRELFVTESDDDTRYLDTAIELSLRCTRTERGRQRDEELATGPLAAAHSAELVLRLLSRLTEFEGEYPRGRREKNAQYTIALLVFETATDYLGLVPVESSSSRRPDTCPRCNRRWDVMVDGHTGFELIASFVWKCTGCEGIVDVPMTSNRKVAKR